MNAIQVIQRLHEHRDWVSGNLRAVVGQLTEEQRQQVFPIGQGSIWKSLVHMYAAEFVWLEALLGNDNPLVPGDLPGKLPGNQMGSGGIAGYAELCEKWSELNRRWSEYLHNLSPEALNEPVYKVSTSSNLGQRVATKRVDILLHVCTHAHYTAAQVVNMLRQIGIQDHPDTMLITLARRQSSSLDPMQT